MFCGAAKTHRKEAWAGCCSLAEVGCSFDWEELWPINTESAPENLCHASQGHIIPSGRGFYYEREQKGRRFEV